MIVKRFLLGALLLFTIHIAACTTSALPEEEPGAGEELTTPSVLPAAEPSHIDDAENTADFPRTLPEPDFVASKHKEAEIDPAKLTEEDILNMAALVGDWHDVAYGFGAGYGHRYRFNQDFTFYFAPRAYPIDYEPEPDEELELEWWYGYWRVEDHRLILKIIVKLVIAETSESSTEPYVRLTEPEYVRLELGELELNEDHYYYPQPYRRAIGDRLYWQFYYLGMTDIDVLDVLENTV